jgi:sec-independent protein translocase protein TatA
LSSVSNEKKKEGKKMVFAFGQPGPWQIQICLVLIAVLFGAKRIPDLARSIGKAKGEFKKGLLEGEQDDKESDEAKASAKEIDSAAK